MTGRRPHAWSNFAICFALALFAVSIGCKQKTAEQNAVNGTRSPLPSIAGLTPVDAELNEKRQKQVWDAEHATHLVEHRLGVRFRELLGSRSSELANLFAEDADIQTIDWQEASATDISSVRSTTTKPDAKKCSGTRAELTSWLLNLHAMPPNDSKYAFRVLAIKAAEDQANTWQAKILLTSQSKQSTAKKRIESKHDVTFRWNDIDDLEKSASIHGWHVNSVRVAETPADLMTEVTSAAGLAQIPIQDNWRLSAGKSPQMIRFQMAVADYDQDGLLDIAVSSAGNNLLLHFEGGRFRPVTQRAGIDPTSRGQHVDISASWLDYDNDGFPDLILGGRIYHNDSGKRFVDVTSTSGIEFHPHHMGCAVADYNMDGLLDVYFIYAHDSNNNVHANKAWIGDEQSGGRNQLWKNQGDGTFVDATEEAGVSGGKRQSFAANWIFADDDAFPDLYVANDFGTNSLFRNRGDGTFEDASASSGTSDFATSMGVASGDLDNDGTAEIYVANMYSKMGRRIVGQVSDNDYPPGVYPRLQGACAGSRLYRLNKDASNSTEFSELAGVNQVGWAYAPAMADFNNDGMLDLYATCGFLSVDRTKPDG